MADFKRVNTSDKRPCSHSCGKHGRAVPVCEQVAVYPQGTARHGEGEV